MNIPDWLKNVGKTIAVGAGLTGLLIAAQAANKWASINNKQEDSPEEPSQPQNLTTQKALSPLKERLIHTGASSQQGVERQHNQDNLLVAEFSIGGGALLGVFDGLGGHQGGAIASEIAARTINNIMSSAAILNSAEMQARLANAFERADSSIRHRSHKELGLKNMGTTAVVAVIVDEGFIFQHTGDSRLYHIRDGSIIYRTKDHSVIRYLVEEGALTEEEASKHPLRNQITSCLGPAISRNRLVIEPDPYNSFRELKPGDIVALATDGVFDKISDPELAQLISEDTTNLASLALDITEEAALRGATDDRTLIIYRHPEA